MTSTPPLPDAAPSRSAGHAPLRRPDSVRRTSSIDMTWPQGRDGEMHFAGRARDILTVRPDQPPALLRLDTLEAGIGADRTITRLRTEPPREAAARLVGMRGGGYLRQALDEALPDERDAGSPLYLLIDDLSGTSLIAGWAWSRWSKDWLPKDYREATPEQVMILRRERMEGVCIGFRPGSSALADLDGSTQNCAPVVPLPHPDDPQGWHELTLHTDTSMRRARRIDVWREDGRLRVDAMFQDSASEPTGGRVAIHEYRLSATVDPATMTLVDVVADPRILPYRECPSAAANVGRLVGTPLREMRGVVLQELRKVAGCTHLNDALRALAEVPVLVAGLP